VKVYSCSSCRKKAEFYFQKDQKANNTTSARAMRSSSLRGRGELLIQGIVRQATYMSSGLLGDFSNG